ncbi:MAG: hypothetical protein ACW98D_11900 [Promethearchaeota archaeon]|jgi:hypothetical protein
MINTEEKSQDFKNSSKHLQIQGVCILEMDIKGDIEIIFLKGIDIAVVHNIINSNRTKILNNEEGDIKDYVGPLNAYLVYCNKNQSDIIIALFVDEEEIKNIYSKLDNIAVILFEKIGIDTTGVEIKKICVNTARIPRAKGLVGFLALNKTGILYFSRVKKDRKKISKNIFQIAGFISALMIYSKDLISGEDPEVRLEDINLGSHHFYVNIKNNVIFAYFIEKHEVTENFDNYIQIVVDKFIEKYYNPYITDFRGDLSPFHSFDAVIDRYFKI